MPPTSRPPWNHRDTRIRRDAPDRGRDDEPHRPIFRRDEDAAARRHEADRRRPMDRRDDSAVRRDTEMRRSFTSMNPDFTKLVKNTTTIAQIDQHNKNWQVTPVSIANNIDNIIHKIRPPRPSETTIARLEMAADEFKDNISSIVRSHLKESRDDVVNDLLKLNKVDLPAAMETAEKQMCRRLGKRLHRPTLCDSLCFVSKKLKDNVCDAAASTSTYNRFSALMIEEVDPEIELRPLPPNALSPKPQRSPRVDSRKQVPTPIMLLRNVHNEEFPMLKTSDLLLSCEEGSPKTFANITTHCGTKRNRWSTTPPRPHHNTQIIVDSNGKVWPEVALSAQINVDSFAGLSISDVVNVLKRSETLIPPCMDTIVLAVGVNDRDMPSDVMLSTLQQIGLWRDQQDKRIFFVSAPIFESFTRAQKKSLVFLNDTARDVFGDNFIKGCQEDQIFPHPKNRSPGHYDVMTAERIVRNITSVLNYKY
jgi:hypothetical protein